MPCTVCLYTIETDTSSRSNRGILYSELPEPKPELLRVPGDLAMSFNMYGRMVQYVEVTIILEYINPGGIPTIQFDMIVRRLGVACPNLFCGKKFLQFYSNLIYSSNVRLVP